MQMRVRLVDRVASASSLLKEVRQRFERLHGAPEPAAAPAPAAAAPAVRRPVRARCRAAVASPRVPQEPVEKVRLAYSTGVGWCSSALQAPLLAGCAILGVRSATVAGPLERCAPKFHGTQDFFNRLLSSLAVSESWEPCSPAPPSPAWLRRACSGAWGAAAVSPPRAGGRRALAPPPAGGQQPGGPALRQGAGSPCHGGGLARVSGADR